MLQARIKWITVSKSSLTCLLKNKLAKYIGLCAHIKRSETRLGNAFEQDFYVICHMLRFITFRELTDIGVMVKGLEIGQLGQINCDVCNQKEAKNIIPGTSAF